MRQLAPSPGGEDDDKMFLYWPSSLMDLLSLRLVGVVGARINGTSLHSQWGPR